MIEAMGAMWQPVVNGVDDTDFWKDPVNAGWLANSKNTYKTYYPAPSDEKMCIRDSCTPWEPLRVLWHCTTIRI